MNNILMIGYDLEPLTLKIANLFKHYGYTVTIQYFGKGSENLEIEGLNGYVDTMAQMDWDRLSKELKTHAVVVMHERMNHTKVYDYAKVYGRDVWCCLTEPLETGETVTCDFLVMPYSEQGSRLTGLKNLLEIKDGKQVYCTNQSGETEIYNLNEALSQSEYPLFMVRYMHGYQIGQYPQETINP